VQDNPEENTGGMPALFRDPQRGQKRRGVYLRWEAGPDAAFLVLSEHPGPALGEAIKLDQVGIHHFSFWVEDLQAVYEKVQAAGVPILLPRPSGTRGLLANLQGARCSRPSFKIRMASLYSLTSG
jgi:catechol 2,3-dioxygenase-like lactoylglutathione lyase family enzyme